MATAIAQQKCADKKVGIFNYRCKSRGNGIVWKRNNDANFTGSVPLHEPLAFPAFALFPRFNNLTLSQLVRKVETLH